MCVVVIVVAVGGIPNAYISPTMLVVKRFSFLCEQNYKKNIQTSILIRYRFRLVFFLYFQIENSSHQATSIAKTIFIQQQDINDSL